VTIPTPQGTSAEQTPRLQTPGAIFWLFFISPIFIALGAFIVVAMHRFVTNPPVEGDAIAMTWAGVVMLTLGAVFLVAGIVVVSVRSLLQQQAELLGHR